MAKKEHPKYPRPKYDTRNVIVNFGSYETRPLTSLPTNYLIWAMSTRIYALHRYKRGRFAKFYELCEAEVDRRCSIVPQYFVSKEAIDFISRLHYEVYLATRETPNEGLFSWAERMLEIAVKYIDRNEDNVAPGNRPGELCVMLAGVRWYVQMEEGIPRLVSVGT